MLPGVRGVLPTLNLRTIPAFLTARLSWEERPEERPEVAGDQGDSRGGSCSVSGSDWRGPKGGKCLGVGSSGGRDLPLQ